MNKRDCWCGSQDVQEVVSLPFLDVFELGIYHHRIGCCESCGGILTVDQVEESNLEKYYATLDLYSAYEDGNTELPGRINKSQRQVEMCRPFLSAGDHVLDVGCGSGLTLDIYRRCLGVEVAGTELSETSILHSKNTYDIRSVFCSAYELDTCFSRSQFDMVSLSHVLEHLYNPRLALDQISSVLKDGGYIYVEVPADIDNYQLKNEIPFNYLTIEHVNCFSKRSLSQLLNSLSFETEIIETVYNNEKVAPYYPVIVYIGKKVNTNNTHRENSFKYSDADMISLRTYIDSSKQKIQNTNELLKPYIDSQEPVSIWCAGSFTSRLLAISNALQLNILQIVDSSPQRQGMQLSGFTINSPEDLDPAATHVLVSTGSFSASINKALKEKFPEKKVINLYDAN